MIERTKNETRQWTRSSPRFFRCFSFGLCCDSNLESLIISDLWKNHDVQYGKQDHQLYERWLTSRHSVPTKAPSVLDLDPVPLACKQGFSCSWNLIGSPKAWNSGPVKLVIHWLPATVFPHEGRLAWVGRAPKRERKGGSSFLKIRHLRAGEQGWLLAPSTTSLIRTPETWLVTCYGSSRTAGTFLTRTHLIWPSDGWRSGARDGTIGRQEAVLERPLTKLFCPYPVNPPILLQ